MQAQYLFLLLYLLLFYGLLFGWRSWLLWRRTGINPFTFRNTDDAHDWNGRLFKVIATLVPVSTAVAALGGPWNDYLFPLWYLERPLVFVAKRHNAHTRPSAETPPVPARSRRAGQGWAR